MNDKEFDLAALAWLDEGPTRMSDRALMAVLKAVHATRQGRRRRAQWPAWSAARLRPFARVAVAAAAVVGVGLLAVNVVPRQPDRSGVAGAVDFPELTTTFVSPRNGFSVEHPDWVAVTPATQLWGLSKRVDDGFDVVETGVAAVFKGASTRIDERQASIDRWRDDVAAAEWMAPGGCGVPLDRQAVITIDGQSGRIAECPNEIEATVGAGGRLYLFALLHDRGDARAVFDAFAATIDLTPETAIDYPALTSTFVSPTNGLSFGYVDRGEGTLKPAKELWDPINQPRPDSSGAHDDSFDVVETGLAAVFKSASTAIPDGVSIDAWVDEYVAPGRCGVPRSQQAEITIDGQSGRISDCPKTDESTVNEIEATVVAGGRLYLFILLSDRDEGDYRAFFDAWVDTIDLTPETTAVPTASPSS